MAPVIGLFERLLNNGNFVLALQGSVANKFYVHNDIFRYQDEVFGGFVTEPQEGE